MDWNSLLTMTPSIQSAAASAIDVTNVTTAFVGALLRKYPLQSSSG